MLKSYGSFTAYSGNDEVGIVPCDTGGMHFSRIEEGTDQSPSSLSMCLDTSSMIELGGSRFQGNFKDLKISFRPCLQSTDEV